MPSRYSREAPPPVEMWPNAFSSKPRMRTAAALSPPPTTVKALLSSRASGDGRGAPGVVGVLEDAHRAVPEDGLGVGDLRRVQLTRLGTDVQALLVGGDLVRVDDREGGRGLALQVRELRGDQDVDREDQLDAGVLGALHVLLDDLHLVLLEQGDADLVALGVEEGVGHAAADEDAVGLAEQLVDDGELVGDLGAAQDHHVRTLDLGGQLLQDADLGGDEVAGRVREAGGQVEDRGVPPVHGAEAVAHVDVGELGELVREGAALGVVLGRLAGVEAQVLDDGDLAVGESRDGLLGGGADGVGGERHVRTEQFAEARGGRGERERRLDAGALGAAQVRGHDDAGAGFGELRDRGPDGADAAVVGDGALGQRDVQVRADEDPLALDAFGEQFIDRLHVFLLL